MSWKSRWIYPVLALLVLIPDHALARQGSYSRSRIGISHVDFGLAAARGNRDFNGRDTRTANLYTAHANLQLSLLTMMLGSRGVFDRYSRLRIGDYWRAEFITGWKMEAQEDVAPGAEVDLSGGDAVLAGVLAAGMQANYLVSDKLEVGGAVAKATWNTTMGFGNDGGRALKPQDEPFPTLWVARARYGSLLGEYHTAATDKYLNNLDGSGPGLSHLYHHSYSSLKFRYFKGDGSTNLGIELDRYGFHVHREGSPALGTYATDRSVMNIRFSFGYSY